jgi:hypothetical protein
MRVRLCVCIHIKHLKQKHIKTQITLSRSLFQLQRYKNIAKSSLCIKPNLHYSHVWLEKINYALQKKNTIILD